MMYTAALTLAAIAVGVSAQGAAVGIAPAGGSPAGCLTTKAGNYQITVVQTPEDAANNAKVVKRQALPSCGGPDALVFTVNNGVLVDRAGRIGSIVANRQFQFDGPPPQTGAIYTGGFSICPNSSLAIGPSTNFYQCKSGNFYNLYDQPSESSCMLVKFNTIQCQEDGQAPAASASVSGAPVSSVSSSSAPVASTPISSSTSTSAVVSQKTDGQPTASSATTAVVTQISDGQPQATTPGNATVTTARPTLATGAAAQLIGSGAIAMVGAAAALFL